MQICCLICRDVFTSSSLVFTTYCGHVYHDTCIQRWMQQQNTCPQCRSQVYDGLIRVYFTADDEIVDDEITTDLLKSKLAEISDRSRALQNKLEQFQRDSESVQEKNFTLKKRVIELENEIAQKNSAIYTLKEKMKFLVGENRQLQYVSAQFEELKKKHDLLRSIRDIIDGSEEAVNTMVKNTPCTPQSINMLATHVQVLKQQSEKNAERYKKSLAREEKLQAKLSKSQKIIKMLESQLESLQRVRESTEETEVYASRNPEEPKVNEIITLEDSPKAEVMDLTSGKLPLKVIDKLKMKRLNVTKPSPHIRLLPSKLLQSAQKRNSPASSFQYDGMGGSKRISLATPTPREELAMVLTRRKNTSQLKTEKRAQEWFNTPKAAETLTPRTPEFVDLD